MKLVVFVLFLSINPVFGQDTLAKSKTDSLLEFAYSQLGVRYKYGTRNPNVSFDCSGFTSFVYESCNVPHSRTSRSYVGYGEKVSIDECRPGDAILFSSSSSTSKTIGHVGIIVENHQGCIRFIHCSSAKRKSGVVITDYYDSGYPKRFMQVRRMYE